MKWNLDLFPSDSFVIQAHNIEASIRDSASIGFTFEQCQSLQRELSLVPSCHGNGLESVARIFRELKQWVEKYFTRDASFISQEL